MAQKRLFGLKSGDRDIQGATRIEPPVPPPVGLLIAAESANYCMPRSLRLRFRLLRGEASGLTVRCDLVHVGSVGTEGIRYLP